MLQGNIRNVATGADGKQDILHPCLEQPASKLASTAYTDTSENTPCVMNSRVLPLIEVMIVGIVGILTAIWPKLHNEYIRRGAQKHAGPAAGGMMEGAAGHRHYRHPLRQLFPATLKKIPSDRYDITIAPQMAVHLR